jgi:hypothetical protein
MNDAEQSQSALPFAGLGTRALQTNQASSSSLHESGVCAEFVWHWPM